MKDLETLAREGQYYYKQMVACISQGYGEIAMAYNTRWLEVLDLIRDGKYQK